MKANATFEVDKQGLRDLVSRDGLAFVVTELIQNSWDEDATRVDVTIRPDQDTAPDTDGSLLYHLSVEDDDPDGFTDITHAYTLFAQSEKKTDATKRGRFNLGEKLVIAACEECTVSTTTGKIVFTDEGRFNHPAERDAGSLFTGTIRMTDDEYGNLVRVVSTLIPPADKMTIFNGDLIPGRDPVLTFEETVWTEIANKEGKMVRSSRKTTVELYDPLAGEKATVYELGIPVVEADCAWHVNIGQKVPLNVERNNLTPGWLRDMRRIVLNHAYDLITEENADESWILDGLGDDEISKEALEHAVNMRLGPSVIADPRDPMANQLASAAGYSVIGSRSLPKEVWAQVKKNEVLQRAGQVTPSPRPYIPGQENTRHVRPVDDWTVGMHRAAELARAVASKAVPGGTLLLVEVIDDGSVMQFRTNYETSGDGQARLELNLRRLGHAWFEQAPVEQLPDLIYALAHEVTTNRLSEQFFSAVANVGAAAVALALEDPTVFGDGASV